MAESKLFVKTSQSEVSPMYLWASSSAMILPREQSWAKNMDKQMLNNAHAVEVVTQGHDRSTIRSSPA